MKPLWNPVRANGVLGERLLKHQAQKAKFGLARFNYALNVFPRSGVVYCETPKVGCTKIKELILNGVYNKSVKGRAVHAAAYETMLSPEKMGYRQYCKWYYGTRNVKTFLFIRDPIERLASAYRDKLARSADEGGEAAFGPEKTKIVKWCVAAGVKTASETDLSFVEFLEFCAAANLSELNIHWAPQSTICWLDVLRVTHIYDYRDFAFGVTHLMQELGLPPDWIAANLEDRANATTNPKAKADLAEIPAALRDKLTARYSGDYRLLDKAVRPIDQTIPEDIT